MTEEDLPKHKKARKSGDNSVITGVILITLGVLFLVDKYFPEINFGDLWPFILIVVGALIIIRGRKE